MNAKKLFKLIRNDKLDAIEMLSDTEKGFDNQPIQRTINYGPRLG